MERGTELAKLRRVAQDLSRCRNQTLHTLCQGFGLRRYGTKQELVERLMKFVESASSEELRHVERTIDMEYATDNIPMKFIDPNQLQTDDRKTHVTPRQPPADVETLFSQIDPFHPIAPVSNPFLYYATCRSGSTNFHLDIPELKTLRRQGYSVWLRSISKTAGRNERHVWPRELKVFVNLSQVARVEEPKRLKKRRDEPIELTAFLQSGRNNIQFSVTDSCPSNFQFGLTVCSSLSNSALLNSVPSQSFEGCRDRIKSIMQCKSDLLVDEAGAGYRALDLRCPITLDKLNQPVRGTMCSHLRCFDLEAFVSVNRQTSNINHRWMCPICQKLILPKDLIQDAYIKAIVDLTEPSDLEVAINEETAEWRAIEPQEVPKPPAEDEEPIPEPPEPPMPELKEEIDLIDLEGDDTEIEEPYQKRPCVASPAPEKPDLNTIDVIELD
jgi:hypothetical protein